MYTTGLVGLVSNSEYTVVTYSGISLVSWLGCREKTTRNIHIRHRRDRQTGRQTDKKTGRRADERVYRQTKRSTLNMNHLRGFNNH